MADMTAPKRWWLSKSWHHHHHGCWIRISHTSESSVTVRTGFLLRTATQPACPLPNRPTRNSAYARETPKDSSSSKGLSGPAFPLSLGPRCWQFITQNHLLGHRPGWSSPDAMPTGWDALPGRNLLCTWAWKENACSWRVDGKGYPFPCIQRYRKCTFYVGYAES